VSSFLQSREKKHFEKKYSQQKLESAAREGRKMLPNQNKSNLKVIASALFEGGSPRHKSLPPLAELKRKGETGTDGGRPRSNGSSTDEFISIWAANEKVAAEKKMVEQEIGSQENVSDSDSRNKRRTESELEGNLKRKTDSDGARVSLSTDGDHDDGSEYFECEEEAKRVSVEQPHTKKKSDVEAGSPSRLAAKVKGPSRLRYWDSADNMAVTGNTS
jgi:hypothetical protein